MPQTPPRKFLDVGSPVVTRQPIGKRNTNTKILNQDKLLGESLPAGSLRRIHSTTKSGVYTVWFCDETTYSTVMVEIPQHMMGQLLAPKEHGMFAHFA